MPRFDQSFSGLCEQNLQDTLQLKQRYLDAKAKRTPKGKDKKQQDSIQSSVHVVQQKFLKRPASDEQDPTASLNSSNQQSNHDSTTANFEPPVKLQCTAAPGPAQTQNEGLTKFSVEIVQQLEFTTSAASSQPQQISTNVTVKTHANASVKSDVSSPKNKNQIGLDVGTLVECVKQEPDNDFADLDQCAAALEKDAAANGGTGCFGGFSDLIGDDTNDEIISSATFNDLISDINNYPDYELMKDFDFDEKSETTNQLKTEDTKDTNIDNKQMPNYPSPPVFMDSAPKPPNGCSRLNNAPYANVELSPAAQTLKQMAEQHHKNQMSSLTSFQQNRRSPYTDFQFQGDYGQSGGYKAQGPPAGYPQPDIVKQEMIFQGGEFDMKRKPSVYKQQYSPYSSPSASSHGSPGYLPRTGTGPTNSAGQFGGGTPPRPPSGPGGNTGNVSTTVSINQAQQLNISQQSHGHTIQVSAGQHVHLSGDLKSGSVSIAAQQGMQFNQQNSNQNQQQQQSQQQQQQQQQPNPSPQQQQQPVPSPMSQQHQNSPVHNSPNPNQNPLLLQQQQQQHPMDNNNAYSLSQTQTINFTQQSLRRSNSQPLPQQQQQQQQNQNQLPVMPARLVNAQTIEQQKLLQQQHFLRMQQQQQMAAAAAAQRPPPPDYKAAAMMQGGGGLQPRYGASNTHGMSSVGGAGQVRRMPHQPMPPSGPMIRSNIYMLQQQQQQQQQQQLQQQQRPPPQALYSRQQPGGPAAGLAPGGGLMDNTSEWRHLLMSQQQSGNFGGIRAPFQQGFNMHNQQITALQHQQMRVQQQQQQQNVMGNQQQQQVAAAAALAQQQSQMLGQATGGNVGPSAGSPMQQMNHMNQAVLHMQQQQSLMQQQHNQHMSLSSVHMQQSQSMTMTNANMQPQQQQQNAISGNNNNNTTSSSSLSCFNPQADFNFEFLDNLTSTDGGTTFTDQELLNSFDTDAGFNLDF